VVDGSTAEYDRCHLWRVNHLLSNLHVDLLTFVMNDVPDKLMVIGITTCRCRTPAYHSVIRLVGLASPRGGPNPWCATTRQGSGGNGFCGACVRPFDGLLPKLFKFWLTTQQHPTVQCLISSVSGQFCLGGSVADEGGIS
jgi:hypothetical protein